VKLDQSTISGLSKGDQRSTTRLPEIARELGTTTDYLTGVTNDPDADAPDPPTLHSDARELIERFEELAPADRRALLQVARSMAGPKPGETLHQRRNEYRPQKAAE
jgi:hypothetical protein